MWDRQASAAVGERVQQIVTTNMRRRVDATGAPYPPGRDNQESGELINSFVIEASADGVAVVNTARHAAPVNDQVPFMGVPAADESAVEDAVEAELARLERGLL